MKKASSFVELMSIIPRTPDLGSMLLPNWSNWSEVHLLALVLSVLCPELAVAVTSYHGTGRLRLPLEWLVDEWLVSSQEPRQL